MTPAAAGAKYMLIARVKPHDEVVYEKYVRETYYPGLRTMPGFVSLRVARWTISQEPNATLKGGEIEHIRITTWASKAAADAYFVHPLRATFNRLLELADVIAYGGAEVLIDLEA